MLSQVRVLEEAGGGGENKTLNYSGPPFVHTSSVLSLSSAPLGEPGDSGSSRSGLFSSRSMSTVGGNFCEGGGNGRRGLWKMGKWFFKLNLIKSNPIRFYSPCADCPHTRLHERIGFDKTVRRKMLRKTLISQLPPQPQQRHSTFP